MASLYETVGRLHDPRVKKRSKHLLSDIVILAVLAVTSGAESYDAIEEFGKYHHETLKKRLSLQNGIPSHDTINRVFQMINFRQFERIFLEWAEELEPEGSTETVIAIAEKIVDGKTDYILALKGNQGTLLQDAELMEKEVKPVAESEEVDKGHGRVETRRCAVFEPTEWIWKNHQWKGLRTIVKLTATRWNAISKEEVSETHWYISSLDKDADFIRHIRGHWGVECYGCRA